MVRASTHANPIKATPVQRRTYYVPSREFDVYSTTNSTVCLHNSCQTANFVYDYHRDGYYSTVLVCLVWERLLRYNYSIITCFTGEVNAILVDQVY
jgi:hypothetical protein